MKFPIFKIFSLCTANFAIALGTMMVFTFQPFMVNSFFPDLGQEQLGWKTGYISGVYFFGSFLGGFFWGWLADTWGRRPSIFIGLTSAIIMQILYGFSRSFLWALVTRCVWGIANGITGVLKTSISENLDSDQQARGFATYGMSVGLAGMLGPVVGGFLSHPADKYSFFQNHFVCKYPFLLPLLISVGLYLCGLIGISVFVGETLERNHSTSLLDSESCSECDVENSRHDDTKPMNATIPKQSETNQKSISQLNGQCKYGNNHKESIIASKNTCKECFLCCKCVHLERKTTKNLKYFKKIHEQSHFIAQIIADKHVCLSLLLYCIFGGVEMASYELFVLLMISDHQHGGYGMNDSEIGFSNMVSGIFEALFQLLLYPWLVKLLKYRGLLAVSILILSASLFLLPWEISLPVKYPSSDNDGEEISIIHNSCGYNVTGKESDVSIQRLPILVWLIILIPLAFLSFGRTNGIVTATVLVNNSSLPETRGTINGIGQSLVSVSRAVTHYSTAVLFAWSQNGSYKQWPLNYHFVFIVGSVIVIFLLLILCCLPNSIEERRINEDFESNSKNH